MVDHATHATTGSALHCVVVPPERALLDQVAEFIALPMYDGELGVLPGRAPLIGRLGAGELRLKTGTAVKRYFVEAGVAQVRGDVGSVLTARAGEGGRGAPARGRGGGAGGPGLAAGERARE